MLHSRARLMLVSGYLGAVIGAGFASGQEIVQFLLYMGFRYKGCILAKLYLLYWEGYYYQVPTGIKIKLSKLAANLVGRKNRLHF